MSNERIPLVETRHCGCGTEMTCCVLGQSEAVVYVCPTCDPGTADQLIAADIAAWRGDAA